MQYDETSFMQMALCYHTIVVTVAKLIAVSLLFPVQWVDVIIELVLTGMDVEAVNRLLV